MAQTKAERLAKVHAQAMREFVVTEGPVRDERMMCLADRRFASVTGAQWEGPLGRQFENKPKVEVNKVLLSIIRIFNEYRNNRITVDFIAKDGTDNDMLADACNGLYRADEQDSQADEAYDNAFEEAVTGGYGAWRLRAVYEDEFDPDDDRQRIRIEPIYDADSSVFFDLNAKRQDKSDADYCFVITSMSRDAFVAEYGEDGASWQKGIDQAEFDWCTPDVVYVAEYYRIEEKSTVMVDMVGLDGTAERLPADDEDEIEDLTARGYVEVRRKPVKSRKVRKYIMSGAKVLEDCGYIAGQCIPIVPVYGKRWFIDNMERCMGHVRVVKDVQRLYNMQLSRLAEISALSPIRKPIFTPEQVAGHELRWASDAVANNPYMLINPIVNQDGSETPAGPVGYTEPPNVPEAMAALLQLTNGDISELLGNQQEGERMQPNISGKAIELVQNSLGMQPYIYMSNMAKAVRRCGEIWLSMAREIMVEPGRKMKSVSDHGDVGSIELMKPMMRGGVMVLDNNISEAKFDVVSDVGPSSISKRQATVRALTGMMGIVDDPETKQVLTGMTMMNMEGEGIRDVNDFFRKRMVAMGVMKPTEEEQRELEAAAENAQPDPQAQLALALAKEADAKAINSEADTVYTLARAEETKAQTAETLAGIGISEREMAVKAADGLLKAVQPPATQRPQG